MDNLIEKIETFLSFSDIKLAELEKKNQELVEKKSDKTLARKELS
ncbi:SP_0009 family protein [Streptococcus ictaluri]|uniref:Recombinase n=1 Tax=Streptococcus ictaluri 707-05 TaxID=764299 RepID=G5K0J8_9STRE|nr:SP_0009 family protein [Streptococcus ictaluri]EHI70550.1 hypothetical protein STRIC_0120 [Streptococcus ictaluri 707-05]